MFRYCNHSYTVMTRCPVPYRPGPAHYRVSRIQDYARAAVSLRSLAMN
jgi:hypothetical protein